MTSEQLEKEPAFQDFIANFARYCGTSRRVFLGQLAASVTEYEKKVNWQILNRVAANLEREER